MSEWRNRIVGHGEKPASQFQAHPLNWRKHPKHQRTAVRGSLDDLGWVDVVIENVTTGHVVDGHERIWEALEANDAQVPYIQVELTEAEEAQALLSLDAMAALATTDGANVAALLEQVQTENAAVLDFLDSLAAASGAAATQHEQDAARTTLAGRFGVPPFSVLDARQGYWQDRKDAWYTLGVTGDDGERNGVLGVSSAAAKQAEYAGREANDKLAASTSAFDPVLCEVVYRWFAPAGGSVLDPFAGEAVKGIVAGYLGHAYTGIELQAGQVATNQQAANGMNLPALPTWVQGDAAQLDALLPNGAQYDLVFTSPPYYDLEVYSADAKDGSAMPTYDEFMQWYRGVFAQAVQRLRDNRFLVVKVGEVRNKATGVYRNFVADNIACFTGLGLAYYNEMVLLTAIGSLPIRAGRQFTHGRKVGKAHQNVLVFYKGDPKEIKQHFAEVEVVDLPG